MKWVYKAFIFCGSNETGECDALLVQHVSEASAFNVGTLLTVSILFTLFFLLAATSLCPY
jgi:hypothetical protein